LEHQPGEDARDVVLRIPPVWHDPPPLLVAHDDALDNAARLVVRVLWVGRDAHISPELGLSVRPPRFPPGGLAELFALLRDSVEVWGFVVPLVQEPLLLRERVVERLAEPLCDVVDGSSGQYRLAREPLDVEVFRRDRLERLANVVVEHPDGGGLGGPRVEQGEGLELYRRGSVTEHGFDEGVKRPKGALHRELEWAVGLERKPVGGVSTRAQDVAIANDDDLVKGAARAVPPVLAHLAEVKELLPHHGLFVRRDLAPGQARVVWRRLEAVARSDRHGRKRLVNGDGFEVGEDELEDVVGESGRGGVGWGGRGRRAWSGVVEGGCAEGVR
jgi:hypothetical protein